MWRVGRKLGRTIYRQVGRNPSAEDQFVGIMDTPEQARMVVVALERFFEEYWKRPAIHQEWRHRTARDPITLRVLDARADGKYLCRIGDARATRVVTADDLNFDYELVRTAATP